MKKPSTSIQVKARRISVLERLQKQLKSGFKIDQETKEQVPLTDKNKSRIEKEIEILKTRI